MMRTLESIDQVFDEIGDKEIARLTGRSASSLSNWRADGCFPRDTYVVLVDALSRKNCRAPPALWRMIEVADGRST